MIGTPSNSELMIILTVVVILWAIWIRVDSAPTKRPLERVLYLASLLFAGIVAAFVTWYCLSLIP